MSAHNFIDLTGQVFSRLTVISYAGKRKGAAFWNCLCECGTNRVVASSGLRSGNSRSCGCLLADLNRGRSKNNDTASRLYAQWAGMKTRCYNKNSTSFKNYGGRGIAVADSLMDYQEFRTYVLSELGPCPKEFQLDRVDNNGDYRPGNLRWSSRAEQCRNRRSNLLVSFGGEVLPLVDAVAKTGLKYQTVRRRLRAGWSEHDALTTPVKATKRTYG